MTAARPDRVAPFGHRADAGFSLLEIFVALLILSVGLLFLAMVQLSALTGRSPSPSPGERVATNLAQVALDRLAAVPWEELASAGDSMTTGGTTYYRVWQVRADAEIPALKTVTVWCSWRHGEGPWRQVVLVTQRSKAVF